MVLQALPLRLCHLLLECCAVEGLQELEGAEQVLGNRHDCSKVVKLAAVADVSSGRGVTTYFGAEKTVTSVLSL